jgi:quinol monooxygenase YgiN
MTHSYPDRNLRGAYIDSCSLALKVMQTRGKYSPFRRYVFDSKYVSETAGKLERPSDVFIFARFHAREGKQDALRETILDEIRQARDDYGCLTIGAYASIRDSRLFFIHSRWVDNAAFDAHAETSHTLHFVELAENLIDHPLDVHRTRVL